MANRETYPASQSPLTGDIDGPAGATRVKVIALQTTPIDPAIPNDQDVLVFQSSTNRWTPTPELNKSIMVNGGVISDDYDISVNLLLGISDSPVFVNGA